MKLLLVLSAVTINITKIEAGEYQQLKAGQLCSPSQPHIQTLSGCIKAAAELGLQWGDSWDGPDDHPGCLHATDSRDKVYFNTSRRPGSAACDKYLSLCKDKKRIGNYKQLISGQLCSQSQPHIESEADCKEAASELGLEWGNAWDGPEDHPGCLHTTDSRNKVYFNISPEPASTPVLNYLSLCHATRCPTHVEVYGNKPNEGARKLHHAYYGIYTKQTQDHNGKNWYVKDDSADLAIWFNSDEMYWMVGLKKNIDSDIRVADSAYHNDCPNKVPKDHWRYWVYSTSQWQDAKDGFNIKKV